MRTLTKVLIPVFQGCFGKRRSLLMLKRAFDIVVSLTGLLLVLPVLMVAAILVKLDSRGPVLFRQDRVGRNFRKFRLFKIRTMRVNNTDIAITCGADPRITRVGKALRSLKIDELPQLWNVLCGDMSFVGPRPEVPRYTRMFHDDYAQVLTVRPGITSAASLKYRDEAGILGQVDDPMDYYVRVILPDKLRLEKEYIKRCSLRYDLSLILATLQACLQTAVVLPRDSVRMPE
jgi:lipopolysaccharide/colanic/teichoic acid biosynthesis glycosyltransferase